LVYQFRKQISESLKKKKKDLNLGTFIRVAASIDNIPNCSVFWQDGASQNIAAGRYETPNYLQALSK
jgi:hypothetical protein